MVKWKILSNQIVLCKVQNFIKTEALAILAQNYCHHWIHHPCNYGLKEDRYSYWQVSNLTGIENHKKLLSLLNSPPSLWVEYEISSEFKHLLFYGLTDDRCQNWQSSKITKNYCHHWIHHPRFVQSTKFHQNWNICCSSSKTVAEKMTGVNIDKRQESQKSEKIWVALLQN